MMTPMSFLRPKTDYAEVPDWDYSLFEQQARRVAKMQNHELLDWADACGSGMSRAFSDYRRSGHEASLQELRESLQALWALVHELDVRHQAGV
jgi:hypothetical protein